MTAALDILVPTLGIENKSDGFAGKLAGFFSPSDKTSKIVFDLAERLKDIFKFYAPSTSNRALLWRYDEERGIWVPDGEDFIRKKVRHVLSEFSKAHLMSEILTSVRAASWEPDVELGGPSNKIVVANGILSLDTGEFTEGFTDCAEEYHSTAIPIKFDPDAKCNLFEKFLSEVLSNEEDRLAVAELFGYCLVKDYRYALWVMLTGSGANGKSVLLNVLKSFLGTKNVTGVPIQQIGANRFSAARLHTKLANICADIPKKAIEDAGIIKMLTGGDMLTAEHKNLAPFEFTNFAKLIFSANQIPKTNDESDAFHRRARIMDFPVKFGNGGKPADPKLTGKLTTSEELSGILNLALEGWRRMDEQGGLSGEKSIEEKRVDYYRRSDPIQYFVKRFIHADTAAPLIPKAELYEMYTKLCHAIDHVPVNDAWFGKRIRSKLPYLYETQFVQDDGSRIRAYRGIGIKREELEKEIGRTGSTGNTGNSTILGNCGLEDKEGENTRVTRASCADIQATLDEPESAVLPSPPPKPVKLPKLLAWVQDHMAGNCFSPAESDSDIMYEAMLRNYIEEESVGFWVVTKTGREAVAESIRGDAE